MGNVPSVIPTGAPVRCALENQPERPGTLALPGNACLLAASHQRFDCQYAVVHALNFAS